MKAKNPADATQRNVKASKKRDAALKQEIGDLKRRVKHLERAVYKYLGVDLR